MVTVHQPDNKRFFAYVQQVISPSFQNKKYGFSRHTIGRCCKEACQRTCHSAPSLVVSAWSWLSGLRGQGANADREMVRIWEDPQIAHRDFSKDEHRYIDKVGKDIRGNASFHLDSPGQYLFPPQAQRAGHNDDIIYFGHNPLLSF